MKFFYYPFIILFIVCNAHCLGNGVQKHVVKQAHLSTNTIESQLKKNTDAITFDRKVRSRKGINPSPSCISSEFFYNPKRIFNNSDALIHEYYYFESFSGNRKRGPPSNFIFRKKFLRFL